MRSSTLLAPLRRATPARFRWDGRDADSAPVAAGVYFLRVRGPSGSASLRSVRLR